jgi:ribosomal protein S17E
MENNQSLFTTDYEENKKALDAVSEITSKKLRNQIAGCITKIKNNEKITPC